MGVGKVLGRGEKKRRKKKRKIKGARQQIVGN
jgi:hypothetical protein